MDELALRRYRRQQARQQAALALALDHLDAAGLCCCWVVGRRHWSRSRGGLAPTGIGGGA